MFAAVCPPSGQHHPSLFLEWNLLVSISSFLWDVVCDVREGYHHMSLHFGHLHTFVSSLKITIMRNGGGDDDDEDIRGSVLLPLDLIAFNS